MLMTKISQNEMDMMDYYRMLCAGNDCGDFCSNEYLLREWRTQKLDLFKMLNYSLSLSKEVSFFRSEEQLSEEIEDFLYGKTHASEGRIKRDGTSFYSALSNYNEMTYGQYASTWSSDYDPEKSRIHHGINNLLWSSTLAKNKYEGDTFSIPIPGEDNKFYKVSEGCKVTKALGKIAKLWDIEGFEDFRIGLSQILNQKCLKGNLTLSIHPLDYWTMSDNDSDWSSCMSWEDNGCYRQGTVEMMNSPTVIVAYLSGHEDMTISHKHNYHWNNKKWRQLFIVHRNAIIAVKSYPYENNDLTETTLNWIKELAENNLGWSYEDSFIKYSYGSNIERNINGQLQSFSLSCPINNMYSDFGSVSYHALYLSDRLKKEDINHKAYWNHLVIPYSGKSECMVCGDLDVELNDSEDLACLNCSGNVICEYCGNRVDEDYVYQVDDQYLCEDCYYEQTATDILTGDRHFIGDMDKIQIIHGDEINPIISRYYEDETFYTKDFKEFKENFLRKNSTIIRNGQISCSIYDHIIFAKDIINSEELYDPFYLRGEKNIISEDYLYKFDEKEKC